MPFAPSRPCKHPMCSALVGQGEGTYCPAHKRSSPATVNRQLADRHRGTAASRGYDADWQRARFGFLAKYPLCPGVLLPTERWTIELAIAFHHERERRRELGELLWQQAFSSQLSAFRFCPWDTSRPAVVVDHIVPHHGDHLLMWAEWNWQPLTARAHNRKTATEQAMVAVDESAP